MSERFVTFDVWDTLLRRRCDPVTVKLFTCRALLLLHSDQLAPRWQDAWRLLWLRHRIEVSLLRAGRRQGSDGEYRIDDVLGELLQRCCRRDTSEHVLSLIAADLQRIEIAQERFVSYRDPDIVRVIEEQGSARLAFLSDFHLPSSVIAELLREHGLARMAEVGIASCDVGLAKKSGRLYQHARDVLGIGSRGWLHVGDDEHADMKVAAQHGIETLLFLPPAETKLRSDRERMLGKPELAFAAAFQDAVDVARRGDGADCALHLRAVSAAPLLSGFSLWVLEQVLRINAGQVRFTGHCKEIIAAAYASAAAIHADVLPVPSGTIGEDGDEDRSSSLPVIEVALTDTELVVPAQLNAGSGKHRLVLWKDATFGSPEAYMPATFGRDSANHLRRMLELLNATAGPNCDSAAARESLLTATSAMCRALRTHAVASEEFVWFAQSTLHMSLDGDAGSLDRPRMEPFRSLHRRGIFGSAAAVSSIIRATRALSRLKRRLQRLR